VALLIIIEKPTPLTNSSSSLQQHLQERKSFRCFGPRNEETADQWPWQKGQLNLGTQVVGSLSIRVRVLIHIKQDLLLVFLRLLLVLLRTKPGAGVLLP